MEVTVKTQCGRCGKSEEKVMGLEDAQALEAKEANLQELVTRLGPQLNELLTIDHPDLVIASKNSDGTYSVETLDNLCSSPEAKRNKGCLGRVHTLIDDMFMRNQPAKKKTVAKKNGKNGKNGAAKDKNAA